MIFLLSINILLNKVKVINFPVMKLKVVSRTEYLLSLFSPCNQLKIFFYKEAFQGIPIILLFYSNMLYWRSDKAIVTIK